MSGNTKHLIAFNYFGGKFTWLNYLYDEFPSHFNHMVDLFAGSMCVSINYPRNCIKTANEINGDVTNFFEVLRNHTPELLRLLELTPCSLEEYNSSWEASPNKIEQARRFYVRVRQSFFGLGAQRQNKGWHMAKSQLNCSGGETVSRWNNGVQKLYEVAQVIRNNFQITNLDYKVCIDKIDNKEAFFYCDPPYPEESRKSFNDYRYEFTDEDHYELSEKLKSMKGMWMISSYECPLMEKLYKGYKQIKFPVKMNNIRSSKVQEVIWVNYEKDRNQLKLTL